MSPICVIAVAALSKRMLDLAPAGGALRRLAAGGERTIQPVLPAVTCTMQATLTTGVAPDRHGIIANGLYFPELGKVSFWEQSNKLVEAPRFWQKTGAEDGPAHGQSPRLDREGDYGPVAMLFWQNSMFGAADIVVTPRPIHTPDGKTLSSCYSAPADLYDELVIQLGPFELKSYWGPFAGLPASQWIAQAAGLVWKKYRPRLQLVYLPHLDYALQKVGPDAASVANEVAAVDALVGQITETVQSDSGQVVVLGDYGMVPARRAVLPNVALRQAGLLQVRKVRGLGLVNPAKTQAGGDAKTQPGAATGAGAGARGDAEFEMIEVGELAAGGSFAMVDHQVAHVYCGNAAARKRAKDVLRRLDGVAEVLDLTEEGSSDPFHLRHRRSGQLVALAEPDAWFAYYWWTNPAVAPPFARTVDIHQKPGYDPGELFIDPVARGISLNPALVQGTHGLLPADAKDRPVLLASRPLATEESVVEATAVAGLIQVPNANCQVPNAKR